jgi:hypothetical protein
MNVLKLASAILVAALAGITTGCTATGDEVASDRECRALNTNRGTRMRESVCMSKEEWAAVDARETDQQTENNKNAFFKEQLERAATGTTSPTFNMPN